MDDQEMVERMVTEYITKEQAIDLAKDIRIPTGDGEWYRHRCIDPQAIRELHAADVRPVVRGEWEQQENGTWVCSKCKSWIPDEQHFYARFCLHCGAKMGVKRLTYYENGLARYDFAGVQYQNKIADRLAAYEDTGLEPEEVRPLKEGHWVKARGSWCTPGGDPVWECSECGKGVHVYGIEHGTYGSDIADGQWVSCPNCGAMMGGDT